MKLRLPSFLTEPVDEDEGTLAEQGYTQELNRSWGLVHNFGVSFSIISVITGITTLFQYGLTTGGPGVMSVGWLIVNFFTFFVGLGMAEVTSAHPTSGGPYFWAAMLAPNDRSAAFFSWITGWFNFLGQVAVTTGITFGCAGLISTLATVKSGFEPTAGKTIGIHAALLVSHGLVNTFGVNILKYLNNSSILLHSLGITCFAIAVVAKAPTHQSAKFVFSTFNDGTGDPGWSTRASPAYVACIGILMSHEVSQPVLQILLDIFGEDGAIVLFTLIIICVWHCGLFSLTSNSRMMFGFARDRGLPSFFHKVDDRFKAPVRTIWLAALLAFLLAVPSLGSTVAFAAATSIATIGLYISYGLPILIGLLYPSHFKKGPFDLGKGSRPVAIIAVTWITFITVIFCLPNANPVNSQTLNYTPVAVGIVALWAFGSWFLWARKWYVGPIRQIEAEAAGVNIEETGALEQVEQAGKI